MHDKKRNEQLPLSEDSYYSHATVGSYDWS
jgi:hypothetical protein